MRPSHAVVLGVAIALLGPSMHGCTDVGDSSAVPAGDAGVLLAEDAGGVVVVVESDGGATADDAAAAASAQDAAIGDAVDGAASDATLPTSGDDASADGAASDDGSVEVVDATIDGGGAVDAGVDSTLNDAGAADATVPDSGLDAGAHDAAVDSGHDAGSSGGADAAADAPSGLVACTSAGQVGCVQCQLNDGAGGSLPNKTMLCTPTEAALVAHDVAAGLATAAGPDPDGSCYQCAALSGCLDDSEFNDQGHECEDLSGSGPSECAATLACVLGSACGATTVSTCYCGTAPVSGSCAAVGGSNAANGACKTVEAAGLGFSADDGLDVLKSFTSTTLPSGVANNIFQCAASNGCTACLQ
jgi:hypothetical protein